MINNIPSFQLHQEGYKALLGGFLIHIMIGTFFLWGNINVYVTSYLRYKGNDVTTDIINSTFPFMGLTMGLFTPFGLDIGKKFGIRKTALFCSLFFSLCAFLASFQTDYLAFTLIYGFASGIASGIVYMIPYSVAYCHFPQNKGLASGIISAGFGSSTFFFSWIVFFVANPNNVNPIMNQQTEEAYFPDDVSKRIPDLLRVLSLIFLIIGCIGSYLCCPPSDENFNKLLNNSALLPNKERQSQDILECKDIRSGLQTPFIYFSVLLMTFYGAQGQLILDNYKPIGTQLGNFSDVYLTTVGSIGSLFNGFIRILWGRALDTHEFKDLAVINQSIAFILMATFYFACFSEIAFIIWVIMMLSCFGGWSAMVPPLLADIYGKSVGTVFYGITVQGQTVACWMQFFIVQKCRISLGWFAIFMIYSGIVAGGLACTTQVNFRINWTNFYRRRGDLIKGCPRDDSKMTNVFELTSKS